MATISQDELAQKINRKTKEIQSLVLAGPPDPPDDTPPPPPPHLLQEHLARVAGCTSAIDAYESGLSSARTATEAYLTTLDEYEGEVKRASDDNTFLRQTYYLNVERDSLESWNMYLSGALLCLLVVYAKHAFYDLKVYKKVVVWVVLFTLLVVAIWTTAVVRRVLQMPRAVSVYSTWAQPNPNEWHGGR
jgi:hypothetical protein